MSSVWGAVDSPGYVPGTPNLMQTGPNESPAAIVPQIYNSTGSTPSPFWPTPSSIASQSVPRTPQATVAGPPVFSIVNQRRTSSTSTPQNTPKSKGEPEQVVPGTPQSATDSPHPRLEQTNSNNNNSNQENSNTNNNNNNSGTTALHPKLQRMRPRRGSSLTDQVFSDALLRHAQTSSLRQRRAHSDGSPGVAASLHRLQGANLPHHNVRHRSTPSANPTLRSSYPNPTLGSSSYPSPPTFQRSSTSSISSLPGSAPISRPGSAPSNRTGSAPSNRPGSAPSNLPGRMFRADMLSTSSGGSVGSTPQSRGEVQRMRSSPESRLVPDTDTPCLELFCGNDIFL